MTVTVELTGTLDEVVPPLRLITRALGANSLDIVSDNQARWLTPSLADELVADVSDKMRVALRAVCEKAPRTPFEDVFQALGVAGPKAGVTAGGTMASLGFFQKRHPDAPQIITRDYTNRVYHVDRVDAEMILAALKRYEG